jgi:hypothetical protein
MIVTFEGTNCGQLSRSLSTTILPRSCNETTIAPYPSQGKYWETEDMSAKFKLVGPVGIEPTTEGL